ncbi:eCIS core domain-containing protein [Mucilaginibacter flavus]|uniref:eCIS core domain-containing protein n=1 Tax=Mucilaginibacter flavus TaxID=931504 RepID=UPI0025B34717|nr:DUF4157 domain-containing protein [Mucilaginibacter flavus]MDN3581247.1 DUF4157 domain-containing protein [Mucilaginibacter flavus]
MKRYRHRSSGANRAITSSGAANIQRKLTVGETNDPMEQQADDMADKVMRMPERSLIQREVDDTDDENINRKPLSGQLPPFIQAKGDGGGVASPAVTNGIAATRGGGQSMSNGTKSFMESRFGNDFSDVRIHTDDYAAQMSNELNAQAFTVGNDIYFNSGKYAPEVSGGKRLLAHELTHTIQQGKSIKPKIQKQGTDDDFKNPMKLTMPKLLPNLPDYGIHLGDYKLNLQRPAPFNFQLPLFKFLPPVNLLLTPSQIRSIIGTYSPDLFATIPDISEPDNDGLRLGGDQFMDMFTGNNQITAVARGLDFYNVKGLNTVFDALDILHEPGVTFTAATPGSGTLNSVQFGISLLNFHYGKKVEFAPVQLGVDTGAGVTLGSQVELHTLDPHYSYFFNFGYTIQPGPKGTYQFNTTGISFSFFPHFLNP